MSNEKTNKAQKNAAFKDDPAMRRRFGTVVDVAALYPLTESAVRNKIYRAEQNGLKKHLRKVGRRVLIDLDGFESWINKQPF